MLAALFAVAFVDELASGVAPASVPDIAHALGMNAGSTASAITVAYFSLAVFVEAPILAWSEKLRARWVSSVALATIAVCSWASAISPHGWVLLASLSLYGPAAGVALAVAEGTVVEADPQQRERTMARFTLAASVGDLTVPILLAALAWLGLGYRAGFAVPGTIALLLAISHALSRSLDRPVAFDEGDDDDSSANDGETTSDLNHFHEATCEAESNDRSVGPTVDEVDASRRGPPRGFIRSLRQAFMNKPLLAWSFAGSLTGLLDEVLVAFAAIHLDALGASMTVRSWAIGGWVVGGIVGVAVLERLSGRVDSKRILYIACAITGAALVCLALSPTPAWAGVSLSVVGMSGATLHPITKARAYAAFSGRPAMVNAVASSLVLLDVGAPILFGLLVNRFGGAAGPLAILLAPVGVALVAWRAERRS